jgi:uncharacterized membrane protein
MALKLAVDGGARTERWQAIDVTRGAAIAAMIVYHFAWDLSFFHLIATSIVGHPFWQAFARVIAGSFLTLVGIGLVLAHDQRLRGWAFLRRLAIIAGAAAGVTVATWFAFPDSYIFFGILHCIALSSVLALPFLRAPVWLVGAAALLCFAAPLGLVGPAFDDPALAFLGLGTRPPVTNDYVPVFPWFGLVLTGVAVARAARPWALRAEWPEWRAKSVLSRALAWGGRWSLPIYLLHQPVLLGAVFLAAQMAGPTQVAKSAPFLANCRTSCQEAGKEESLCRAACVCVVEKLVSEHLWDNAVANRLTARDQARIAPLAETCFKEVEQALHEDRSPDMTAKETRP